MKSRMKIKSIQLFSWNDVCWQKFTLFIENVVYFMKHMCLWEFVALLLPTNLQYCFAVTFVVWIELRSNSANYELHSKINFLNRTKPLNPSCIWNFELYIALNVHTNLKIYNILEFIWIRSFDGNFACFEYLIRYQ